MKVLGCIQTWLIIVLVFGSQLLHADICGQDDTEDDDCGEHAGEPEIDEPYAPDLNPNPGYPNTWGFPPTQQPTTTWAGMNRFRPYSGNVKRRVIDLALANGADKQKLAFQRITTSRWIGGIPTPFGSGGSWRHNYYWYIEEGGFTNGAPILVINSGPSGAELTFYKKATNDLHLTANARIKKRVLQSESDTNQFYLMMYEGTRYAFYRGTNGSYQMQGFYDPYERFYDFSYDDEGQLTKVVDPNTNHYIDITYSTPTNFTQAGWMSFQWVDTNAGSMCIAGDWNNWNANGASNPMYNAGGGLWTAAVEFSKGTYEYKFVADGTTWYTDTNNPYSNAENNSNSILYVGIELITSVGGSDGRSVTYDYDMMSVDGLGHATLINANYGDGTSAEYSYAHPATGKYWRPMLVGADDPMLQGPDSRMSYSYQRENDTNMGPVGVSGMISEELHLVTSQLVARLIISNGVPEQRLVEDADGETTTFVYPTNAHGRISATTNPVDYVERRDYFGDDGMLWRTIDPMGRTNTYGRTWHFGNITSIVNSVLGTNLYHYTDDEYPAYISSNVDQLGRATHYSRDGSNRITRIDFPDGTYRTYDYNMYSQVTGMRARDGENWTYTYDDLSRLLSVIDPMGYTTDYGYDAWGRRASETNALGYVTTYDHNWRGLLTNVVYADGSREVFAYDNHARVTNWGNRAGGSASFAYDEWGYPASQTDPLGHVTSFTYDPNGRLLTRTTPSGLVMSNVYDAMGRPVAQSYSTDATSYEWHFDPDGVRTQINRLGDSTAYAYDPAGRVGAITDPEGRTTSYAYDRGGRLTHVTNALGDVTTYTYDEADRVVGNEDCSGSVTSNEYGGLGRLLTRIEPGAITNAYTYDGLGRLTGIVRSGQLLQSNAYNAVGWIEWRKDPTGLTISNTFDQAGRLLKTYVPDNTFWEYQYTNTYLFKRMDRAGRMTTYNRDVLGGVTNLVDNATNAIQYAYDALGNVTNLTDQAGNVTSFAHDQEGRLLTKTYADSSTMEFLYNAEGLIISKTDARGRMTSYGYDSAGNLTNINYDADADITLVYDDINRVTEMSDGVGTTIYSYDESCVPPASVDGPFTGDTITYSYDEAKRLTNMNFGASDMGYVYDGLDRITDVTGPEGVNTYAYKESSFLVEQLSRANGSDVVYQYDPLSRVTNLLNRTSAETLLSSFAYAYDDADQRMKMEREDGHYVDYTYDPIGQVLSAHALDGGGNPRPGYQFTYSYDAVGNPLFQDRNGYVLTNTFNSLNQAATSVWSGVAAVLGTVNTTNVTVTVSGTQAVVHADSTFAATNVAVSEGSNVIAAVAADPAGRADTNQVTVYANNRGYWYDANGNLTNVGQSAYVFNDADRLSEVRDVGSSDLLMTCRYDGLGRRRERVVYADGVGTTNRYIYHDWLVIAVLDGNDNVLETYRHGPDLSGTLGGAGGIGGICEVTDHGAETNSYFYHCDALGNVINVTDTNEDKVASYSYSPFGIILTRTGDFESRYAFSSKEWDAMVGLYYYGHRYYNPGLGRWLSRDPISESGGVNLYQFARNNPLYWVDYLGLNACHEFVDQLIDQYHSSGSVAEFGRSLVDMRHDVLDDWSGFKHELVMGEQRGHVSEHIYGHVGALLGYGEWGRMASDFYDFLDHTQFLDPDRTATLTLVHETLAELADNEAARQVADAFWGFSRGASSSSSEGDSASEGGGAGGCGGRQDSSDDDLLCQKLREILCE